MNASERQLSAMAFALLGKRATISAQERLCVDRAFKPTHKQLADAKKAIHAGGDPLGDELIAARSTEQRRSKGTTYTPAVIVSAMLDWAARHPTPPARVVDPGSGSGRFLMEAAVRFPKAQLVAIDVDPLAMLILRANATILGFASRLTVKLGDFRSVSLDAIDRPTLFIGNPPYVRHHDIAPAWKDWFAETAASFGLTASKLAGLHIHFFLRTGQLAREGDFGAFITAAEWLDVNYGSVLRAMLADGHGGVALHL
ncbi:MAG: Eco57I restriction-modification methylase domain-containing protein, partial [Methylocella sp.]